MFIWSYLAIPQNFLVEKLHNSDCDMMCSLSGAILWAFLIHSLAWESCLCSTLTTHKWWRPWTLGGSEERLFLEWAFPCIMIPQIVDEDVSRDNLPIWWNMRYSTRWSINGAASRGRCSLASRGRCSLGHGHPLTTFLDWSQLSTAKCHHTPLLQNISSHPKATKRQNTIEGSWKGRNSRRSNSVNIINVSWWDSAVTHGSSWEEGDIW